MSTQFPPKKNAAFRCFVALISQANTKVMQSTPTLAIGDVKVSIDGGALANLTTLPVVTPAAGKLVQVDLSAAEMNGDNITLVFSDAAGAEWCDLVLNLQTTARQIDDLAYPVTSGRSLAVDASGQVNVGALANNALTAAAIAADAITAAKIADGAIDAATFAAGAITAAAIAADAIGASELAADAIAEIQSGLSTLDAAAVRTALGLALANLDTQLAAIGTKTTNLPASPAAVGSAMTLTSGERDSIAAAQLDLANGVEAGLTERQALRLIVAALAGKLSGAATTTITIRNAVADSKDRITATVDSNGNRSAVSVDVS